MKELNSKRSTDDQTFKAKAVFIAKATLLEHLNPEAFRREHPCKAFYNYKGLRAPSCGCRPCLRWYLLTQNEAGNKVFISDVPFTSVRGENR